MRRLVIQGAVTASLVIFVFLSGLRAQDIGNANVQFDLEAYELAIETYETYLESNPVDAEAMYKLAMCYERTNDLIRAARWYEKLFVMDADRPDEQKIAFGKVLKSLGLLEQANELFVSCYSPEYKMKAEMLSESCALAEYLLKQEDIYQIYLFYPSSEASDFAPSFWNDKLVFASFRDIEQDKEAFSMDLFHAPSNKLYVTTQSRKAKTADVKPLGSGIFPIEGISSTNYSSDGKKVLYTKNTFKDQNRQIIGTEKGMSAYMADVDVNGDFLNEYALPFNSTDHSVAFACFGEDENTIFFSANNHDEKDNFDLYRSEFNGVVWSEAISLGDIINSPGNEVTPYYHNNKLYFSSDMIPGMGGYDVFRADMEAGIPLQVFNMGKGVNSIGDDLYLVKNTMGEHYYVSNRLGGKGNYDIYVAISNQRLQHNEFIANNQLPGSDIPKAVSLEKLNDKYGEQVALSSAELASYNENLIAPANISLEGAVRVAYGEVINSSSMVYFIQLASLSSTKGNVKQFNKLVEYGNVYRVKKHNSYKIRLGYFHGAEEAKSILTKIRKDGYRDAFIVEDVLNVKELELLISSFTFSSNSKYEKPEIESEYKVRLAAYSNPLYFDTEKIKDLGVIEQWSKGKWTIFILSGYKSLDSAKNARIKAVNRGFTGAELVRDDDGVLTRVKVN